MYRPKYFSFGYIWIPAFVCHTYYQCFEVIAFLHIHDFIRNKRCLRCRQYNTIYSSLELERKIVHYDVKSGSTLLRTRPLLRTITRSTSLDVRKYSDAKYYDDNFDESSLQRQRITERPPVTETRTDLIGPGISTPKPKIVVLGASGKIGRLVIRQLLDMPNLDATIVAFCRDYDKACRVLYDDIIVVERNKRGSNLQIIQGNLVPPQILPRRNRNGDIANNDEADDEDEEEVEDREWLKRAESAAKFYGTKVIHYDNRFNNTNNNDSINMDSYEALQDAIQDCTIIISCIGSTRITNIWTDYIQFPFWRLFRRDVSHWCTDPNHPYYVHYASTLKVLQYAEKEQLRRDAAAIAASDTSDTGSNTNGRDMTNDEDYDINKSELSLPPRIRFVRISDLVCSQQPWHIIPIVTNMIQSMVIRYHAMSEKLLQSSTVIDTITVRPGDLTDEVRDESTTTIEINPLGIVDCPSRIGRDDVAATVVAAALFDFTDNDSSLSKNDELFLEEEATKTSFMIKQRQQQRQNNHQQSKQQQQQHRNKRPFHFSLACRWTGNELDPYPPQGKQEDGKSTAYLSLKACLPTLRRQHSRRQSLQQLKEEHEYRPVLKSKVKIEEQTMKKAVQVPIVPLPSSIHRRNTFVKQIKPYGICVAIPVYLLLIIISRSIIQGTIQCIPSIRQVSPILVTIMRRIMLIIGKLFHIKFWTHLLSIQRTSPNYISF
jgi:hypothetical protein